MTRRQARQGAVGRHDEILDLTIRCRAEWPEQERAPHDNDTYGHAAGDDCLRALAEVLQNVALDCDRSGVTDGAFAARYGGEEFVLVMPRASAAAFKSAAERVMNSLRSRAIEHAGNPGWGIATVSIGGCHSELANGRIGALFQAADRRLYDAKAKGRNRAHLDTRLPSTLYELAL